MGALRLLVQLAARPHSVRHSLCKRRLASLVAQAMHLASLK